MLEVIFPMLRLKNKQRWDEKDESDEAEPELVGNSDMLPTGLEYEEMPDNEEIEAAENAAMKAAHCKYKSMHCW
ncbi:MAG: hypothetical protein IJ667_11735 [Synergistaceae bacterium]|nr:hypothetical protein [Synergistaceae bacterium]